MRYTDETFKCFDFEPWDEGLEMRAYTADFETTTDLEDCRVWAYAVCEIDNPDNVVYGNSIEDFMRWCEIAANCKLYFHNLGFDGAFIMDYLERTGWEWVEDARNAETRCYTTLISDMNQIYSITLYFSKAFKVVIYDSLKIVPLSIKNMAKAYNLDMEKGELDYTLKREVGHAITDEEKDYIRRDVQIAAKVMRIFLQEGLTKMTAGANALYDYKKMLGGARKFRRVYPVMDGEADAFMRKAYRGGFTYLNPRYTGKALGEGIVLDVNSLYPSVMASCDGQILPVQAGKWFDGEYTEDRRYPLWIAAVTCRFKVKPEHIPCIQLKGNSRFKATEYLSDSVGEVTFACTNVDWELIRKQYDIRDVHFIGGYKFQALDCMFTDYVDKWVEVKNKSTIDGNAGKRQIAKLMLNSLYGKFATRCKVRGRKPQLVDDVLRYVDLEEREREPVYLPVGIFITSYARYKTVTAAQSVYDRFIYADTDSLHLIGTELPEQLDVDNVRLGAWAHESTFEKAKFLRVKCYMEQEAGSEYPTVHVAGMPAACHRHVTFDNFDFGAVYDGKLYTRRVNGGIVLEEGTMEIRRQL